MGKRSSTSATVVKNVLIASMICLASGFSFLSTQPRRVSNATRPIANLENKILKVFGASELKLYSAPTVVVCPKVLEIFFLS
jgi:hypothetical protein